MAILETKDLRKIYGSVITHDSRIARMAERQFQIVDGVLTEVTAK